MQSPKPNVHIQKIYSKSTKIPNYIHQLQKSSHRSEQQMTIASPLLFKVGCATMLSVLSLGAIFGHEGKLSQKGSKMFMKGQLYNVTNALGFIACSFIPNSSIPLKLAVGAFALGQTIFIAPLYYTAVTDKKHAVLTKMMPAGGASLLVGWGGLLFAA